MNRFQHNFKNQNIFLEYNTFTKYELFLLYQIFRCILFQVVKSNENIEKYVGGKNKLLQYLEKNIENDGKY